MRIKQEKENISYYEVKDFFAKRAKKYRADNPYSVTMCQDDNPQLVIERNKKEIQKLTPLLQLSSSSKVLDIACGIGRWAEAIQTDINLYCGLDFSDELIDIARKRNTRPNFSFYVGSALELKKLLAQNKTDVLFDTILIMGVQVLFNDADILSFYEQVCNACDEHAIICMREPIGIEYRLTLKDFFSEELQSNYNAIYRTREEYHEFHNSIFIQNGFSVSKEGFMFDDPMLNNREETAQYYWVLKR